MKKLFYPFLLSSVFTLLLAVGCKKKEAQAVLPSVETIGISTITMSTAICQGEVSDEGSSPVTRVGVCWSTEPEPNTLGPHIEIGAGSGKFNATISPLIENTTYHVRAYASNSQGTAFGAELTFNTSQGWALIGGTQMDYLLNINSKAAFRNKGNVTQRSLDGSTWTDTDIFHTNPGIALFHGRDIFSGYGQNYKRSADNGSSWTSIGVPPGGFGPTGIVGQAGLNIFGISGTVGTSLKLMRTQDNGANWTLVSGPWGTSNVYKGCSIHDVVFVVTFDGTKHHLFRSDDEGQNWSEVTGFQSFDLLYDFNSISFSDDIIFCLFRNTLMVSSDNGKTFVSAGSAQLKQVISSGKNYYAVNTNDEIIQSIDKGKNWTLFQAGFTPYTGGSVSLSLCDNKLFCYSGIIGLPGLMYACRL